ncbi:unnamed protein product [Clonostachys rosea]|uniref:Dolichol-phosphate mannosyltransferase subunit 3 n=1 Tax=Bionectria ochroleuca TaxID=29856 RepID=A0ABY6UXP5_BIOOC|nr:unnamed protein product [Clonostachys rosea]
MTRAQQTISLALLASSLYLVLFLELIPLPALVQEQVIPVVRQPALGSSCWNSFACFTVVHGPGQLDTKPIETTIANQANSAQLPFWALISFGSLLLFRLGLGVMTFNDVPEAHKELMAEIDLAKADLRSLGVDVD